MTRDQLMQNARRAFLLAVFSDGTFNSDDAQVMVTRAFVATNASQLYDDLTPNEQTLFQNIMDELADKGGK